MLMSWWYGGITPRRVWKGNPLIKGLSWVPTTVTGNLVLNQGKILFSIFEIRSPFDHEGEKVKTCLLLTQLLVVPKKDLRDLLFCWFLLERSLCLEEIRHWLGKESQHLECHSEACNWPSPMGLSKETLLPLGWSASDTYKSPSLAQFRIAISMLKVRPQPYFQYHPYILDVMTDQRLEYQVLPLKTLISKDIQDQFGNCMVLSLGNSPSTAFLRTFP